MFRSLFTEHPESVGETYLEHMGVAFGFGFTMVTAGLACLVHGLIPGAFVKTGSAAVTRLYDNMVRHRRRVRDSGVTSPDALEWVI